LSTPAADVPTDQINLPDKYPDGSVTDYVVKKGDTLSDIAKANNVSVDDLMKANSGQTIVKPDGQSITWNDANALSDVDAMGNYTGPGTGVQQDYSVSTSPKIANPDVLATGQTIKIPAPTGATPYAGNVGLAGDTWNKIGSGQYPYSQISANQAAKYGLKENVKLKRLPVEQLIDQKLTVMAWALVESAGKPPARNIHLTHTGVLTVIENVDRHRRALLKELDAMGPGRANIPAVPRPDMPGVVGRGLNAASGVASKIGNYFTKQAQNFTRKVTAAKLKTEWEQKGHFTDSDEIAAFLAKQGVPQGVISDVYGKMGIPITAPVTVPDGTPAPQQQGGAGIQTGDIYAIDPATGKPYEKEKLAAKWNTPAPAPAPAPTPTTATTPGQTNATTNGPGFNATNVMQLPGMEKYAKTTTAAPAKTANFGGGPTGYGKTTMGFKSPAAPAAPKAPAGQKLTPAEYVKKIGAPALPESVAETLRQIDRMLESVTSKKSAEMIKAYADQRFTDLGLRNTTECKQIMAHVVHESAVRRRAYAQRMAK
jgi:LysM repeat protein